MTQQNSINTFSEFWPHYVAAHRKPITRVIHLVATASSWIIILLVIATSHWRYLLLIPFVAYGLAWYSHFFIEHNKPATFGHPLYSLAADYKMAGLMLTGRMTEEIKRLNLTTTS
jgi:hypothetical protein